jgi:carboxylesterase type B
MRNQLTDLDPVVDGDFTPELPENLLREGRFDHSLKVIAAHNILEGLEFMDPFAQDEAHFEADLKIYFPTIKDDVVQHISKVLYPPVYDGSYGYINPTGRGEIMVTEAFFTCNTYWLGKAFNYETYNYIFSIAPSLHGDDIPYTYYDGPNASVKDDALAIVMQKYFTRFAETGDPNGPGTPYFPKYGRNTISQNLDYVISLTKDPAANARCDWWQLGLFA